MKQKNKNPVIEAAIAIAGTQKKLASACGVSQSAVQKWLYSKAKVAPENVHAFVEATGGKFKDYQVRPDLPHMFKHPEQAA
ncbi:YdaS family helix-turn-helix protein [Serratia fonticola]|uniref:transcriptional regulator n=1 Tax=Serratia fonticola TaxID=47917 RepID=UPI003AAF6767